MHQYSDSELKFIQQRFKLSDLEMDVFMAAAHHVVRRVRHMAASLQRVKRLRAVSMR